MSVFCKRGIKEFCIDESDSLLLHKDGEHYIFIPDSDNSNNIYAITEFCENIKRYKERGYSEVWLLIKINNSTIFKSLVTDFEEFDGDQKEIAKLRLRQYKKDIERQLDELNKLEIQPLYF